MKLLKNKIEQYEVCILEIQPNRYVMFQDLNSDTIFYVKVSKRIIVNLKAGQEGTLLKKGRKFISFKNS